jgi:uncharacterized protein
VPEILQILHYDYVPDIVERRGEHRPAHLEKIKAFHADGRLVMAGAAGDPPYHGLLIFRDAADAEAFAADDPYVTAGLVTKWTVEPWNIVT